MIIRHIYAGRMCVLDCFVQQGQMSTAIFTPRMSIPGDHCFAEQTE